MDQPFVTGSLSTSIGDIPQVGPTLTVCDKWGTFKARWGVGRHDYKVDPGLYALGRPNESSPVLVTANYKMSFDQLRSSVGDRDYWILVLDTDGVNVWCAAGKGTFGTGELVERIASTRLAELVAHNRIVLPQLAGPGVAAHEVKKLSGFKVTYGPIRADHINRFIDAGFKATPEMRRRAFPMIERIILIPVELVQALKTAAMITPILLVIGGLVGPGTFWANAASNGLFAVAALFSAVMAGAVVTPILLPWLPGRAFSLKGVAPGLAAAAILTAIRYDPTGTAGHHLEIAAWFLLVPALTTFLSMNFTGASTYTSLSGVTKEMRYAVPAQIVAAVIGAVLWIGSGLVA